MDDSCGISNFDGGFWLFDDEPEQEDVLLIGIET